HPCVNQRSNQCIAKTENFIVGKQWRSFRAGYKEISDQTNLSLRQSKSPAATQVHLCGHESLRGAPPCMASSQALWGVAGKRKSARRLRESVFCHFTTSPRDNGNVGNLSDVFICGCPHILSPIAG
ncbi:hypothetical protein KUCAC02_029476, partial [Chaenocephalus aceratus]